MFHARNKSVFLYVVLLYEHTLISSSKIKGDKKHITFYDLTCQIVFAEINVKHFKNTFMISVSRYTVYQSTTNAQKAKNQKKYATSNIHTLYIGSSELSSS